MMLTTRSRILLATILPTLIALEAPALAQDGWVPPNKVDIPAAYQGHWVSFDLKACPSDDPDAIDIGPRSIYRYEKYEFLELGQLNEAETPAEFVGMFAFAENLDFGRVVEGLKMQGALLIVTTGKHDSARPTAVQRYRKCNPAS